MGAARTAAHRGACTLIVQAGALGGECTFLGCVLSKALIAAAARGDSFATALAGVRTAVGTIAATETDDVFRRKGIDVVHGWAAFRSPREIDVDGRVLSARRFIVATGTEPDVPPIDGLKAIDYLTNENVFELESPPDSLVVLGGGAIGCELAQAFARLGSRVTVVEALDRLLPREEPDASTAIAEAFAAEGIDVRVGAKVSQVEALEKKWGCPPLSRRRDHGDGRPDAGRYLPEGPDGRARPRGCRRRNRQGFRRHGRGAGTAAGIGR